MDPTGDTTVHWLVTAGIYAIAGLLWTNMRDTKKDVDDLKRTAPPSLVADIQALRTQNDAQERELATLKANHDAMTDAIDRLTAAFQRFEAKLDDYMMNPRSSGHGGGGTNFPPPLRGGRRR